MLEDSRKHYILGEDIKPVALNLDEYVDYKKFKIDNKIIQTNYKGLYISTVFLPWNQDNLGISKKPIVFETMVFDRRDKEENFSDCYCDRHTNYIDAVEGHLTVLKHIMKVGVEAFVEAFVGKRRGI